MWREGGKYLPHSCFAQSWLTVTWLNADMPLPLQVLDEALIRRLHLTPSQAAQLPLHLHLHCLHLPGARPRDTPSELLAPLPPYFSRTLQYLGLHQQ